MRRGEMHGVVAAQAVCRGQIAGQSHEILVDLDHGDLDAFAEEIAGYGSDVVVEQPPELVDAVVERLRGVVAARGGAR